ncbi:MAG TPA: glycine-rich protein, partial [Rhizomicrobium sp.]
MIKRPSATEPRAPLSAGAAFVVHLTTDRVDVPDALQGRVEHVRSGESLRFASVADLVGFMQRVLAGPLENHATETTRACEPHDGGHFAAQLPRSMQVGSNGGQAGRALRRMFVLGLLLGVVAGARPAAAVSCGTTGVFYDIGENPDFWNAEAQCVYRTPGLDTFTVPPYWPQLGFKAYGAGNDRETGLGGWNGTATDLVAVGQVFDIRVGGQPFGSEPILGLAGGMCDVGGFNGGGNSGDRFSACGGAGASDVRPHGGSLSDRLVVGGGGGGSIFPGFLELGVGVLAKGGAGGGASARDGVAEHGCVSCGDPGGGGNQFGGGPSPGNASSAGFGFGGAGGLAISGFNDGGAGGGGGWYGGGGSGAAFNPGSGGGGSGYPGQGGEIFSNVNSGNGEVIVTLIGLFEPLTVTVALTSDHTSPVAAGTVVMLTAKVTINSGAAPVGKVVFTDYSGTH